eukprot:TRINITY_DN5454_c1_g4_i1.p1 TRINITY_DN5454_c1_g4~~TRINITY_DN5454_c1_g4_i1.p1  ORF type:complete len:197 (-),score=22.52 TRINITY_DN5454_c1_g4_i1:58-648(-)
MGKTGFEEAVEKSNRWSGIWAKQRRTRPQKEPSEWVIGAWGKPVRVTAPPPGRSATVPYSTMENLVRTDVSMYHSLNMPRGELTLAPSASLPADMSEVLSRRSSACGSRPSSRPLSKAASQPALSAAGFDAGLSATRGTPPSSMPSEQLWATRSSSPVTKMSTTHALTESKRAFCLDQSVLGRKYSPAYVIPRKMY